MTSSVRVDVAPASASMFTLRRCAPFLLVFGLAALSPAIPHNFQPIATWWILAWLLFAVMIGLGFAAQRQPRQAWLQTVAPLVALPAIQALRAADGFAASGFSPLLFLPVVWFALYGKRRDVLCAIVGSLLVLVWPIVLIGSPRYPASGTRGVLLLFIVILAVGLLISALVESGRSATARLAVSERRFRAAFDDAPMGMALTAVAGPRNGYFIRVNRALCAMLGRSAAELTSKPVTAFTFPEDAALDRLPDDLVGDPGPHRAERRYLHSSGRTVWASVSFSLVVDNRGEPEHLITQFEDVGARRDSDRALLDALQIERAAAERMRELDLVRSELMSGVAHDLRTPLTAASGFTELLSDETSGPLNAEQHALLNTVSRSLNRLGGMVDELVATARRDRERSRETELAEVDIDAVVDGAVQTTNMVATARHQHINWTRNASGARVRGDANRLDRALVNLMGNAVKFTPDGGGIGIETHVDAGKVVISVSDRGIGIREEEQKRIFERYYRSDDAIGKSINGTGLGLAIVSEIVSQHGGTVSVTSVLGKGSTFVVCLPLMREPSR